jgi:site-specific recombinase XerC
MPDALVPKLRQFWRHKAACGERLAPAALLLYSHRWRRLSKRRVQVLFRAWQVISGFDRLYPFHALRHTAVTNVYRASRDLFLAQRFAWHASPLTTIVYTHVSDEELLLRVRGLAC